MYLTTCAAKYFLALKCLLAAFKISPHDPTTHAHTIRFRQLCKPTEENKAVFELAESSLPAPFSDAKASLASINDAFLKANAASAPHHYAYVRAQTALDPASGAQSQKLLLEVPEKCKDITLEQGLEGIALLREIGAEKASVQAFAKALQAKWPAATILEREASR